MRLTLTTLALLLSAILFAQAPALIPYQAIARNAAGEPLASSTLNARFTIHDGTAIGTSVWQELQTVSTSALGLFTVQLGSSVALTNVNWANGAKFMQVEIDLGSGFVDIGTQQLLSVPYALHAGSVHLNVSAIGDTLFVGDGSFVIVPNISAANDSMDISNPNQGSMIDQAGQIYRTVIIGDQEWMAENLNVDRYRNGDLIQANLSNTAWNQATAGAWNYYNNDFGNSYAYGKLYNWFTCVDERKLCPLGWRVPTTEDWNILIDFLGGTAVAGGKMKMTGSLEAISGLWRSPNTNASNNSGFSAVPEGYRVTNGNFASIGNYSFLWSSTPQLYDGIEFGVTLRTGYNTPDANFYNTWKTMGHAVRCIRE